MLHFIGAIGFNHGPAEQTPSQMAARRLGGSGFGPVQTRQGENWLFAFRAFELRDCDSHRPIPAIGRNGNLILIGSGRVDRRRDLIDSLSLDPRQSWSDIELMLAAVERWGEDAAGRLHGDFSFAAWDCDARRLILARDAFGTMPLFYHRGADAVWFGTNPAALLALGGLPRDLDPAGLGEHLMGRSADPEVSIYRALKRVPRASVLTIDQNRHDLTTYWRPCRTQSLKLKDDQAYVEATREVLADVMSGHLRATRPIGVMLSGGFDSGAIASTLAMLAPDREIFGYTSVPVPGARAFQRGAGRELQHVEALARMHPNLRIRAVAEKTDTPLDAALRDIFEDIGSPLCSMGLMTRRLALVRAAQQDGVGLLLRGDGGNWTLTAEGETLFRDLFRSGRWLSLLREIVGTARYRGQSVKHVFWREAMRDIVPRWSLRSWQRLRDSIAPVYEGSFLRPEFAHRSGLLGCWDRAVNSPKRVAQLPLAEVVPTYLQAQPAHAETVTLLMHRMGMESAAPLRDRRLVDFILSLPADQFRRNGVPRFLARRVLADRMPAETLAERGYFEPFPDAAEWLPSWWNDAARRLEEQTPVDLAEQAIDLPRLKACMAAGFPEDLAGTGDLCGQLAYSVANTLHVNDFIRWHAGRNN